MTTQKQMDNISTQLGLRVDELLHIVKNDGMEYCDKCEGYVYPDPVLFKATGLENICPDCGTITRVFR